MSEKWGRKSFKISLFYLSPDTCNQMIATWNLLPDTCHLIFVIWYLLPGTWFLELISQDLLSGKWYLIFVTKCLHYTAYLIVVTLHLITVSLLSQPQQQHNVTQPQHSCWVWHEKDFANPTTPPHTNSTAASVNLRTTFIDYNYI